MANKVRQINTEIPDRPDPDWLDPPRPCGHEWRNNDFICMDCVEARIAGLQAEITEFEQTDLVPRSRYNAADAEAREARENVEKLAQRAATEIERLETANNNLQAQVDGLRKAANAALINIQGMLNGDDLPSMVIRDMLRAALYPNEHSS